MILRLSQPFAAQTQCPPMEKAHYVVPIPLALPWLEGSTVRVRMLAPVHSTKSRTAHYSNFPRSAPPVTASLHGSFTPIEGSERSRVGVYVAAYTSLQPLS